MSMFRSIQAANKYVPTKVWIMAREELLFSKVFDRMTELRNQSNWSALKMKPAAEPPATKSHWDLMLEAVKMTSIDFKAEREWKRAVAKALATEASFVIKAREKFQSFRSSTLSFTFNSRKLLESLNKYGIPLYGFPGETATVPLNRKLEITDASNVPLFLQGFPDTLENPMLFNEPSWTVEEDQCLSRIAPEYFFAWKIVSSSLNCILHRGYQVRSAASCQNRFTQLANTAMITDEPEIGSFIARKHLAKLGIMKSSNTRLISGKSLVNKKLSLNAHQSHEAAARKANLSISKILSPSELAMRRMQRQAQPNAALPSVGTPMSIPPSISGSPAKQRPSGMTPMGLGPPPSLPPGSIRKTPSGIFQPGIRPPLSQQGSPLPPPPSSMQQQQQHPVPQQIQRPYPPPGFPPFANHPMGMVQRPFGMFMQQQMQQQHSPPNLPNNMPPHPHQQQPNYNNNSFNNNGNNN